MPTPRPAQPVVIWFGRVGDMIMLSALLEILHRRFGGRCRVIGAGSWSAQIYATHPHVAETLWLRRYTVFFLDPRWWRMILTLWFSRDDPVYVCETDPRKLARIGRLLRFSGTRRERCVFLSEEPASLQQVHWVDRLVSLGRLTPPAFQASDYPWPAPSPRCAPLLVVSPEARVAGNAWLRKHAGSDTPLVLLQPGNRRTMRGAALRVRDSDDRFWPVERWVRLIHLVHERLPAARIVLCGAPREHLLLDWIEAAAALPGIVVRGLPFPGLFALCAAGHSMISIDTGTAHAAAALGLPLVVLFGSTPPAQIFPRSSCGSPVIGVGGVPHATRVDALSVQEVFDAWCRLLTQPAGAQAVQPEGAGARLSPKESALAPRSAPIETADQVR